MSRHLLLALSVAALAGCASNAPYVWARNLPPDQGSSRYVVNAGDVLYVRVYTQDNLSTHTRVRPDGKIVVPLVGEVNVRGRPPDDVSAEIESRLKEFVVAPKVTVTVDESPPTSITVLGQVVHPGIYTVDPSAGVMQALAVAGGFNDYAGRSSIYLVRHSPPQRIRFTFDDLDRAEGAAAAFRVHTGDVVVVE